MAADSFETVESLMNRGFENRCGMAVSQFSGRKLCEETPNFTLRFVKPVMCIESSISDVARQQHYLLPLLKLDLLAP